MRNPHGIQPDTIQRCRQGDVHAFEDLIDTNGKVVWQMCFRLVGNRDEADDLSQEVWIAVWRHIGAFRGDSCLLTWMKQIAVNVIRQSYRKSQGHATISLDAADENSLASACDIDAQVQHRHILALIATLPDTLKRPLLLAFRRGMSYADIARREGCTVAAVKMRISRARALLSGAFDQSGDHHV